MPSWAHHCLDFDSAVDIYRLGLPWLALLARRQSLRLRAPQNLFSLFDASLRLRRCWRQDSQIHNWFICIVWRSRPFTKSNRVAFSFLSLQYWFGVLQALFVKFELTWILIEVDHTLRQDQHPFVFRRFHWIRSLAVIRKAAPLSKAWPPRRALSVLSIHNVKLSSRRPSRRAEAGPDVGRGARRKRLQSNNRIILYAQRRLIMIHPIYMAVYILIRIL